MRDRILFASTILAMLAAPERAAAHHAMEYIEIESYSTARKGEFVYHLHYDYMVDDAERPEFDHWELTPGVSYGITSRLMFDLHTHFAKFGTGHLAGYDARYDPLGPSPFMEAAAGCFQYRLTEGWPVELAVAAGFEIPFARAKDLLGSEDFGWSGLLIASRTFEDHSNITLNICHEREGDEGETFWAIGGKRPLTGDSHGFAAGVEIMGSFEETGDNWSVLPGFYMPLGSQAITLKSGIELGKGGGADILRSNVTLMYRF
ncbi:MAG TPA: hypothetical protein VLA34_06465 [Candidatus Krumholzibacterium sp.]|nr:hypothetical protein [Candidatus Krumholzibacterium sp.]